MSITKNVVKNEKGKNESKFKKTIMKLTNMMTEVKNSTRN